MPPRQKFTREEIIERALEIVREMGIDGLTARNLGDALQTSSRPIFTAFENMEEVKQHVLLQARQLYNQYVEEALKQENAFKGVGQSYIRFAIDEPKLFQLLFMSEQKEAKSLRDVLAIVDDNHEAIRSSIHPFFKLSEAQIQRLYEHLWIYTHGIATFCATNVYTFNEAQINEMLDEVYLGIMAKMKEKEK